jgi:hypothetical protein
VLTDAQGTVRRRWAGRNRSARLGPPIPEIPNCTVSTFMMSRSATQSQRRHME